MTHDAQRNDAYPLLMHDLPLHDPFILPVREEGLYYLYNANYGQYPELDSGHSVVVYTSPDLKHWSRPTDVYEMPSAPDDAWYDHTVSPWAPEVWPWNGRYLMLLTLHNEAHTLGHPLSGPADFRQRRTYLRATVMAAADRPEGPFELIRHDEVPAGLDRMTLDGTLAFDPDGSPWMVYAGEWVQMFDGTMEALPLDPSDLSRPAGQPVMLWSASEGPWYAEDGEAPEGGWKGRFDTATAAAVSETSEVRKAADTTDTAEATESLDAPAGNGYCTDGPFLNRTPGGALLCLWSSYRRGLYVLTQAISRSGRVTGPWEQLEPLDNTDAGHAMVFTDFTGTDLLFMHTNMVCSQRDPSFTAHGILYEVDITDDGYRLGRHRNDLDGIADPTLDC